ncbi:MAG TPA: serine protease [Propionibacteriaceae bacterium]|nr:serine protease [Propionibacteriaceae bacterium]
MAEVDLPPRVAAHAAHLLPDLEVVADQLERNPQTVMRRAFPDTDSGLKSRAIVGPAGGLAPKAVDRVDAAISAERKRLLEVGASALDTLRTEGPAAALTAEAQLGIEAIVSVARPALMIHDGAFGDPPPPWDHILGPHRERITTTSLSVGRIGVRGLPQVPYAGTGFLVAEDVVMTNCHVARVFSQSGPDGDWSFQPGLEVELDFVEDPDTPKATGGPPSGVRIDDVIGIHPALDLALLRVTPSEAAAGMAKPLTLMSQEPGPLPGRNVYVLGYPAPDYRNDRAVQRSIFGDRYFVKRLQPGAGMPPPAGAIFRMEPCSTGAEQEDVMFHDASTLGGNSGSCVVDLESNQVMGLHFAGQYMQYNEAVALWRLADDPLLVGAGVKFG